MTNAGCDHGRVVATKAGVRSGIRWPYRRRAERSEVDEAGYAQADSRADPERRRDHGWVVATGVGVRSGIRWPYRRRAGRSEVDGAGYAQADSRADPDLRRHHPPASRRVTCLVAQA